MDRDNLSFQETGVGRTLESYDRSDVFNTVVINSNNRHNPWNILDTLSGLKGMIFGFLWNFNRLVLWNFETN